MGNLLLAGRMVKADRGPIRFMSSKVFQRTVHVFTCMGLTVTVLENGCALQLTAILGFASATFGKFGHGDSFCFSSLMFRVTHFRQRGLDTVN